MSARRRKAGLTVGTDMYRYLRYVKGWNEGAVVVTGTKVRRYLHS